MKDCNKKKIKILMVLGNTRMGGVQAFILNVLEHINLNKFQIDLAINFYAEKNGIENELKKYGCKIHLVPYFKVYNYMKFCKAWNDLLEKNHYDIVYAHSTNSASVFLKIAKEHNCKTIAHSHSAGYRGNKLEQFIKRLFVKNVGKVSDYWFACSDIAAERLYGKDYKRYPHYYSIPNAINAAKYKFDVDIRNKIRKDLGVDDSTFLCGHVGTFSAPKNHRFLMEIFSEVKKKRLDSKLVCCGAGALMPRIKNYAKDLGIIDDVIFAGVVNNSNEYMMAMDVFIFPSLFEGFPVSILEAQSTGLPVVMSDVITKEVDLSDLICRMSLQQSAFVWAEIIQHKRVETREEYNKFVERTEYNIKTSITTLESLFANIIEEK